MLPKAARGTQKVQGTISFDPGTQLEKKLDFYEGIACFYIVPKFQEHPTKNDFILTYPRLPT